MEILLTELVDSKLVEEFTFTDRQPENIMPLALYWMDTWTSTKIYY